MCGLCLRFCCSQCADAGLSDGQEWVFPSIGIKFWLRFSWCFLLSGAL
ncbi:hypothetical protein SynA1825c_00818 [Synechococcus sp. A18-25c]|nr:hypothetical protein SynA1825c_00818 [Synechococcus sp. A18-25c]